jgi:hypothetical protein
VVIGDTEALAGVDPAALPPGTVMLATASADGVVLVADLSTVLLATRGTVQILISDSHVDDFIKNRLRLLAEVAALPLLTTPHAARRVAAE